MPDVRSEWPFQISYEDIRLPRSLVVLRAESAEDLGQQLVQAQAVLEDALATEVVVEGGEPKAKPAPKAGPPPAGRASGSVKELPEEAMEALAAQGKEQCDCDAGWWDNRETKKGRQPDFKCKKCGKGVWLTPFRDD